MSGNHIAILLGSGFVLCNQCASQQFNAPLHIIEEHVRFSRIYDENLVPYSQNCHICNAVIRDGAKKASDPSKPLQLFDPPSVESLMTTRIHIRPVHDMLVCDNILQSWIDNGEQSDDMAHVLEMRGLAEEIAMSLSVEEFWTLDNKTLLVRYEHLKRDEEDETDDADPSYGIRRYKLEIAIGTSCVAKLDDVEKLLHAEMCSNGRSGWVWVRLANSELMLAVYPQGDLYDEFSEKIPI